MPRVTKRLAAVRGYCWGGACLLALVAAVPAAAQSAGGAGVPPIDNGATTNRPLPQKIILPDRPQGVTLTTPKDAYAAGQSVPIVFTVANTTKSALSYDFPTAQQFDVSVSDAKGTEVWRLSQGKVYAQGLTHLSIKPGQKQTYTAVWNGRDAKGGRVPPGTYTVSATLTNTQRPAVTGGLIVNTDPDPNNMGMPTKSPAETGASIQVQARPTASASKTLTLR